MTTTEQAISHYKYGISHDIFSEPVISYVELSIEALEKQIPKKQRIDNDDWRCCPRCNETFYLINAFNRRNKYCGNCGQALDWSE